MSSRHAVPALLVPLFTGRGHDPLETRARRRDLLRAGRLGRRAWAQGWDDQPAGEVEPSTAVNPDHGGIERL